MLVPNSSQVWNNLLTTSNKLDGNISKTGIDTEYCYLHQFCQRYLATNRIVQSSFLQVVNSLFQTCYDNLGQGVRTYQQLVSKLEATFLHAGLLQLVRSYTCSYESKAVWSYINVLYVMLSRLHKSPALFFP